MHPIATGEAGAFWIGRVSVGGPVAAIVPNGVTHLARVVQNDIDDIAERTG